MSSPYDDVPPEHWTSVTEELIRRHPLKAEFLLETVLTAWQDIFHSRIGPLVIGKDIHPQPQVVGFFLHELIPVLVAQSQPGWRVGRVGNHEKDLHYEVDSRYSIEIKTSSNPRHIYGNRSYAQAPTDRSRDKAGYYLTVNFGRFTIGSEQLPRITRVRFGWLDHSDWRPQASPTGQQASVRPESDRYKLIDLLGSQ